MLYHTILYTITCYTIPNYTICYDTILYYVQASRLVLHCWNYQLAARNEELKTSGARIRARGGDKFPQDS